MQPEFNQSLFPSHLKNFPTRASKIGGKAEGKRGTHLLQRAKILSIVRQIRIVDSSLKPSNTSRHLRTPTTKFYNRRLAEDRVCRRRRNECEREEIFDAFFKSGEIA